MGDSLSVALPAPCDARSREADTDQGRRGGRGTKTQGGPFQTLKQTCGAARQTAGAWRQPCVHLTNYSCCLEKVLPHKPRLLQEQCPRCSAILPPCAKGQWEAAQRDLLPAPYGSFRDERRRSPVALWHLRGEASVSHGVIVRTTATGGCRAESKSAAHPPQAI